MAVALPPQTLALKFQVGARTLVQIDRRLVRIPYSLEDALVVVRASLPRLPDDADGYLLTSLPDAHPAEAGEPGFDDHRLLTAVRQRYVRYHVDLTAGEAKWLAGMSANARSGITRKTRKVAAANGGTLDIRAYRTPGELAVFHRLARAISATTYQERLLDAGLPDDLADLLPFAATDRLRAWLMFVRDVPIAYLCCTGDGGSLRYAFVGHDPARTDLSPGVVLLAEALRQLFAERRFVRFDFTEGEGQHKRQFATGGIACIDVLLLRPTIANRVTVSALNVFERGLTIAKRAVTHPAIKRFTRTITR